MKFSFLTEDVTIPIKQLSAVAILASSSLAWFFLFYLYFDSLFSSFTNDTFVLYLGKAIFLCVSASSAIIGSVISEKINRRKFLWSWITFGILATASSAFLQGSGFFLLLCVLLGISFGLGIPSCMAFLADSTKIEERARVSGTIILLTFCIVILASFAVSSLSFGLIGIALLCLVRATSFFALFLDPCDRKQGRKKSWRRILNHRDFASYLFPWLMFNVASGLIYLVWSWLPSSQDYLNAMAIGNPLHFIAAGVFGFISGILADRIGRKLIIIIGLALLGVSFALLGFFTSSLSVIIYLIASGVAWGFLLVVFLAVPGDLGTSGSKERFYALGAVVPLIIYTGFSLIAQMLGVYASATTLSTLLSIIIFISVIPVLYASETLPENKAQSRKLKEYLLKVNKTSKKNQEDQ